jgi:hypothetical protein
LVWYNLRTWVHFIIRVVTNSPIDHVGFIYWDEHAQRWMQAEMTTGKCKVIPFDNWLKQTKFQAFIQAHTYYSWKRKDMIEFALECEGVVKYNFFGLLQMLFWLKRKVWFGKISPTYSRQFCSEFLANAAKVAGAHKKTPKDIMLSGGEVLGYVFLNDDQMICIDKSSKVRV